ncbi:MAG: TIGR01906 family membrane protein [SAR202 cluster bacterium]|jgi:integral membrane protein (TIGR01906 family)|nr:TIGR01906 family membrane protein [SAR202 cluster bacterium]MQG75058.1 TIGR01906 family membrane protein [SAR202 cluster bacterium]|tara:strand:+ start:3760 stop:4452 length:693 start_codon:yes stop_codon:yes gene_type:complete
MILRFLCILRSTLIVLIVPLLLVTTNVRLVADSPYLYSYGFQKYGIESVTGIEMGQLELAGEKIRDYFSNDQDYLVIDIERQGQKIKNLYNQREILHMKDVKNLIQLIYSIQIWSLLLFITLILIGFLSIRLRKFSNVIDPISWGGGLTLGIAAVVGILSLFGFQRLFLFFHLVSFDNDLWILDPTRDYLIMMFPQGFFFDATVFIVVLTLGQALLLWVLPRIIRRLRGL